jgi:hypothetical protein
MTTLTINSEITKQYATLLSAELGIKVTVRKSSNCTYMTVSAPKSQGYKFTESQCFELNSFLNELGCICPFEGSKFDTINPFGSLSGCHIAIPKK